MKQALLSLFAIVAIALNSYGQSPEGFKYQAIVRDAGNLILTNQTVGMRLAIKQGSSSGTTVYSETFTETTNAYGLVNLEIGTGTTTHNFSTIDWANGPYFILTAIDLTGGTSYVAMGTSQLMSVPYALHAKSAENVVNDQVNDADADPTNEIQTISRTGTIVTLNNGGGTFEDSVGIYTPGAGIDITNNVVSTTEPTYTIGLWPELGGYVFWVSSNGKHGLVAETQDQDYASFFESQNIISDTTNHSADGKIFRDWRMPTKYELNEMFVLQSSIGGFTAGYYWSSTELNSDFVWRQYFSNGNQQASSKSTPSSIRAVRTF